MKRLLIWLVAIMGGLGLLGALAESLREPIQRGSKSDVTLIGGPSWNAWIECQVAVKDCLAAPTTAEFPTVGFSRAPIPARWGSDGSISIVSYVDAQNRFGAMIRNPFVCAIDADGKTISVTIVPR